MSHFFKNLIITIQACLLVYFSYCGDNKQQTGRENSTKEGAIFHGFIKDFQQGDLVGVHFDRDFVAIASMEEQPLTNSFEFTVEPNADGTFEFSLPKFDHFPKLYLTFKRGKKNHLIGDNFIVESGDDINVKLEIVNNDLISSFDGQGSAKYNCSVLFNKIGFLLAGYIFPEGQNYSNLPFEQRLDYGFDRSQHFGFYVDSILDKFKSRINPVVYKIMRNEINDALRDYLEFIINIAYQSPRTFPEVKERIKGKYFTVYRQKIDTSLSSIMLLSQYSIVFVLHETITDLRIRNDRKPTYREILTELKKEYTGVLLDKTIAQLFFNPFIYQGPLVDVNPLQYDSCIYEALQIVKTPYLKSAFDQRLVLGRGRQAHDFEYMDSTGEKVRLSDLKGKVVLMDCWYTGCTGCAIFYKMLRDSIEPYFKDNLSFKIISVCTDNSEAKWRKSIYSGIYTSPGNSLNLYAGRNNDLLSYYHESALPFILLIDREGKIVCKITGTFSTIKKIIKQTLEN